MTLLKKTLIYNKFKSEWSKIIGYEPSLSDSINVNKFQAHILHCTALIYGLYIDKILLTCGLTVEKIIAKSRLNDKSNFEFTDLFINEYSLSLYFYCDSLGFRRGAQPAHSKFTYPFLAKKLIEGRGEFTSAEVFIRGRGGLTFAKLTSIICTDIGYLGSLIKTSKNFHFDAIIFQIGLVDFIKFKSSKIYKFCNKINSTQIIDYFILKLYFFPKIIRLFSLKKIVNNNVIFIFFQIGYYDIESDNLLKKINKFIESLCLQNDVIFINTKSMKIDDYLDDGHLTETGHLKYAKLISDQLIKCLPINS